MGCGTNPRSLIIRAVAERPCSTCRKWRVRNVIVKPSRMDIGCRSAAETKQRVGRQYPTATELSCSCLIVFFDSGVAVGKRLPQIRRGTPQYPVLRPYLLQVVFFFCCSRRIPPQTVCFPIPRTTELDVKTPRMQRIRTIASSSLERVRSTRRLSRAVGSAKCWNRLKHNARGLSAVARQAGSVSTRILSPR